MQNGDAILATEKGWKAGTRGMGGLTSFEIDEAPSDVRKTYADPLLLEPEVLEIGEEETTLARRYLDRGILSQNYFDDAQHIALATVAEVDVLVNWNFRHIVHFDKIRQFNAVNLEHGYRPIEIRSPREVTRYGKEGIRKEGEDF